MDFLLFFIFIVGAVCISWRLACLRYNIPWPFWLAWVLKNPYMLVFCNPQEIARRVGVTADEKILDIGCGAGRISIPLGKKLSGGGSLLGVDMQRGMITLAEKYAYKESLSEVCRFKQLNILDEEIKGTFDKVVIVTVLGELPNVDLVIQKISSLLNQGAVISVTEVIPDPCYIRVSRLREIFERNHFKEVALYRGPLSYTMNFTKNPVSFS